MPDSAPAARTGTETGDGAGAEATVDTGPDPVTQAGDEPLDRVGVPAGSDDAAGAPAASSDPDVPKPAIHARAAGGSVFRGARGAQDAAEFPHGGHFTGSYSTFRKLLPGAS
jgi:hypothetical protein